MKHVYKSLTALIILLLITAMIFFFSEQSGTDSHSLSQRISGLLASKLLSHSHYYSEPSAYSFLQNVLDFPIRKLAHLLIYTLLGFGAMFSNYILHDKKPSLRHCFFSILIVFIVASLDETNQYFSDGRGATFSDVIIDTLGGMCGTYFFFILKDFTHRIKKILIH